MGTMILDFADQLYSFMALKYEMAPPDAAEGGIPIEEYDWPSDEFTIDIGRAVMMLAYTYRSSYRRHFRSLANLLCTSRDNPRLYAVIFAKVTYRFHSPLKILILCSFISEMYLFIMERKGAEDAKKHYISPATECFNGIYKAILSKIDDPILKWDSVKHAASLLTKGYRTLEPVMLTEHPLSESKEFFDSAKDVLHGQSPEGAPRGPDSSSASAPSTPSPCKLTLTERRRRERMREADKADALADQLKQTSLTMPKTLCKKTSSARKRLLKTRACGNSAESENQASTSTAEAFNYEHYLRNTSQHEASNKPVANFISPAFRDVNVAAASRVPGVGEEIGLYENRSNEATNESPNNSDTMPVETRSDSPVAKKKSKKNKKKKKGKK